MRQRATRPVPTLIRLAAVPFVILAGATTGLVFLVLLPICGIASIAEGMSKAAWQFVKDALFGSVSRSADIG